MPPTRVIGIDAGGTKLLGGVVDGGAVVHHRVHRLWRGDAQGEVLDILVEAIEEARAAAPDVAAVGLGVPSLIDQRSGESVMSVHLPLDGIPIRALVSERVGLPVFVDNDANAAVLAEHRLGAGSGCAHVVLLTLGTGIGGGLVLGDRLYRGSVGAGAELGHIVVDRDGPECQGDCPGRGCLEVMASGEAIAREAAVAAARQPESALGRASADGRELRGPLVTELAHDGDAVAQEVLAEIGRRLGTGITSLVNAFNPEVVVIGGAVVAAGDLVLEPARAVVAQHALRPSRELVRIVPAHFGQEAGMVGAALLALEGLASGAGVAGVDS